MLDESLIGQLISFQVSSHSGVVYVFMEISFNSDATSWDVLIMYLCRS